jgi:hypothetical protein
VTADLRESKERIEWARQLIDLLRPLTRQLIEEEPDAFFYDLDPSSGWWTLRLKQKPVPAEISFMIGDILHNLRSTLDHLVWQLTIANGHTPPPFPLPKKSQWANIQFPIIDTPNGFADGARKSLWGVSEQSRDHIEKCQPYNHATQPDDVSMLTLLRELSNIDKHRLPNVAVSWLHTCRIIETMQSARTYVEVRTGQWPGAFTEATEIIGIRYDPIPEQTPDIRVDTETDIAFNEESGIGRGMPVLETLGTLEGAVHAIVHGSGKLVGANPWHKP